MSKNIYKKRTISPPASSRCAANTSKSPSTVTLSEVYGLPLRRQLKHLNKRKEKRDRRPRPRASESGGDGGVRARDAGDAHGRVGETRGAALGGALDCTSL